MNQQTNQVTLSAEESARLDKVAALEENYSAVLKSAIDAIFGDIDTLSESTIAAVKDDMHTHYLHAYVDSLTNEVPGKFPKEELLREISNLKMLGDMHPLAAGRVVSKTMLGLQLTTCLDLLEEVPPGQSTGPRHTSAVALAQLAHLINTFDNCLKDKLPMTPRTMRYIVGLINQHIVILREMIQDGDVTDMEIRDMGSAYLIVVQQKLYSLEYSRDPHTAAICERAWTASNTKVKQFCQDYFGMEQKLNA